MNDYYHGFPISDIKNVIETINKCPIHTFTAIVRPTGNIAFLETIIQYCNEFSIKLPSMHIIDRHNRKTYKVNDNKIINYEEPELSSDLFPHELDSNGATDDTYTYKSNKVSHESDNNGVDKKDIDLLIELVIGQTQCSRETAIRSLEKNNNDIVQSIMDISDKG